MTKLTQSLGSLVLLIFVISCIPVPAQDAAATGTTQKISASRTLKVAEAKPRTQAEMEAAELNPAFAPYDYANPPFRSTMGDSDYAAAKAAAAILAPLMGKPGATMGPVPLAPPALKGITFNGVSQSGFFPPDTHGTVGPNHFIEVTNSHLDIFNKISGARVNGCGTGTCLGVSLNSFFGYPTRSLFDPRAIYDPVWKRFIITAPAFAESATVQRFFIAISTSSNPLGSYFIYNLDVDFFNNANIFDFPQLGMDQDSIIITANIFTSSNAFAGADMFAIAKARLYNGLGFSVPVFTGLVGTLAPPIVRDQNAKTFLAAATPGSNAIRLYTLRDSSRAGMTLTGPVNIPVPAYTVPRDAFQPGTAAVLDTSDNRFVNASSQIGNSLWQTHTIALGSFPAPKFYEINTSNNTIRQSGFYFKSGSSDDFNASITANDLNDVYVTWSATDRPVNTNAQVRFSGRRSTDALGVIAAGTSCFTSSVALTGNTQNGVQRWGDYSAVSVDPTSQLLAYLVNEKINSASSWGSRICRIGF
jgi:hypothetical protein